LLALFLDYFNINHPRLTSNTLRIIIKIVECKDVSLEELQSFGFASKLVAIFRNFYTNQQEWCYEELLDILSNLFLKILDTLKAAKISVNNVDTMTNPSFLNEANALPIVKPNEQLVELLDILVALTAHVENIIAEKSITALTYLLYIFGAFKKKDFTIKSDQTWLLFNAVQQPNKATLSKRLIRIIFWFTTIQDFKLSVPAERKSPINAILEKLKNTEDKTINSYSKEIQKCL